jgi:hypothetical protein
MHYKAPDQHDVMISCTPRNAVPALISGQVRVQSRGMSATRPRRTTAWCHRTDEGIPETALNEEMT